WPPQRPLGKGRRVTRAPRSLQACDITALRIFVSRRSDHYCPECTLPGARLAIAAALRFRIHSRRMTGYAVPAVPGSAAGRNMRSPYSHSGLSAHHCKIHVEVDDIGVERRSHIHAVAGAVHLTLDV